MIFAPMRDGNIVRRHLRPAAIKLRHGPQESHLAVTTHILCSWMIEAGANPKDVQGLMRHAYPSSSQRPGAGVPPYKNSNHQLEFWNGMERE